MAVKKAAAEMAPAKKAAVKGKTKAGDVYACEVCGLAVTVDEVCGCVEACDIICCSTPHEEKTRQKVIQASRSLARVAKDHSRERDFHNAFLPGIFPFIFKLSWYTSRLETSSSVDTRSTASFIERPISWK